MWWILILPRHATPCQFKWRATASGVLAVEPSRSEWSMPLQVACHFKWSVPVGVTCHFGCHADFVALAFQVLYTNTCI